MLSETQILSYFYFHRVGLLFIAFFLNFQAATAQNETSKWYFGNGAGLDFVTSPPTILSNSSMTVIEGSASISDAGGNLLFYSDGRTIWDKNHSIMANGSGLLGGLSPSSGCLILKQPGNNTLYYVFTIYDAVWGSDFRYNIIDISLAAGHGSVTTKNVSVFNGQATEKITATCHCNGIDMWVVIHEWGSDAFRAYLLNSTGLSLVPTVSNVGLVHSGQLLNITGCMKISPNGQKLGLAIGSVGFELFDFDNSSGLVSNALFLMSNPTASSWSYGCEFSPDGTKFYGSVSNNHTRVYQWDLCAGSSSAITASSFTLPGSNFSNKGAMQLASDGKIYVARATTNAISVINNPNVQGVGCGFVDFAQSISPMTSGASMPNFMGSYFVQKPVQPAFTHSINGCTAVSFSAAPSVISSGCAFTGFTLVATSWDFGDPASGPANISALTNPIHNYSSPGVFNVKHIYYYSCGGGTDTVSQLITILGPTLSINSTSINCANLGSATVVANAGIGPYTFTWLPSNQTGSSAFSLSLGNHSIILQDQGLNCTFTHSINFLPAVPLNGSITAANDIFCHGAYTGTAAITNLTGGSITQNYLWTNGILSLTTQSVNTLSAGQWSITVTDSLTACQIFSVFTITEPPASTLNLSASTPSVCMGGSIILTGTNSGGTPNYTYTWTNGPPLDTHTVSEISAGSHTYTLNSSDANNCLISNTIAVDFVPNPTLTLSSVSICPLEFGVLNVSGATNYTWSNNSNASAMADNPLVTTQYSVMGAAQGCTSIATASIILKTAPNALVNNNSPRCENTNAQLFSSGGVLYNWDGPLGYSSSIQNPTLNTITLTQAGVYNLTVTAANSCTAAASTTVIVNPIPAVAATGATVCTSQTITLNANSVPGAGFYWSGPIGFSSTQQNPSIANPNLNRSGVYFARATSAQGCTNIATATVNVIPPPSLTVALSSSSLCFQAFNGSPNTITLTSNGASSYSLFTADLTGNFGPSGPSTTVSTMPPFSSTLVLGTATIVGSNGVCTNSVTRNYSVIPNPTVVITPTPVICAGENYTYTSFGASSYIWTSSTPNFTTYHNGGIAVTHPSVNSVFSVFGTSLGCNSASQTSTINVIPLPIINLTPQEPIICLHEKTTLTANGTGTSFEWFPAEGLNNTVGMSVIASPLQTRNYTVIASANSCSNSANITVTVLALPQPTIVNAKTKLCVDETITLKGNGGESYDWFGPQNLFYSGQEINFKAASTSFAGNYTLTVTDENGCKGSTITPIVIQALPQGYLGGLKENVCVPFCGEFNFSANSLDSEISSAWQIGNQIISNNKFSHCFSETGTYTIVGRIFDSQTTCSSTVSYQVKVHSKPQADFYFSPQKPVEGIDEVIFTNASVGGEQNKWNWFLNNDYLPGRQAGKTKFESQNISYKFDNSGLYTIAMVVTNKWNCTDTAVRTIQVETDFGMYIPNAFTPNNDDLNDEFKPVIRSASKYNLKIFDRWGHLIFESSEIEHGWDGTNRAGVNSKGGVYAWRIEVTSLQGESRSLSGHVTLLR